MNADDLLVGENGEALRWCSCKETLLRGRRIACPKFHDCDYCRERALLVPVAERLAFERVRESSPEDDSTSRNALFTRAFAEEMEIAAASLLKQTNGQNA